MGVSICVVLCAIPLPAHADTITVTNTDDNGPGSVRQALLDANDGDTINFAVTGTIGLTSGELLVAKNITISGPGARNLAIDGNAKNCVFHIASGETVTISALSIVNGHTTGSGGGIHSDHATLTLNNCTISGNSGGGIYNDAEYVEGEPLSALLTINSSSVSNNSGGGIYNNAEGGGIATLQITDSTLSNNYSGSAINSHGFLCIFCGQGTATVQITNSSITDNQDDAIYSDTGIRCCPTTVSIANSTISGNAGTAIYNSTLASTAMSNSTISGNGGGIYNNAGSTGSSISSSTLSNNGTEMSSDGPPTLSMENTIFKVSPDGHSILNNGGTVHSFGYNLSSDDGGGYLIGPGPLQDNGGPTFTHALLPGSLAINAGDPNFVLPPDYDQRG